MTVKEVKVKLAKCSTVAEVNALELGADDRKGVIDALAEKIHALTDESLNAETDSAPETEKLDPTSIEAITIALNGCASIEEVNALNLGTDQRGSVIGAIVARINALAIAPVAKVAEKPLSPEELKITRFKKMIPASCRYASIQEGAESFFGEDLKSAEVNRETGVVTIVLKNKTKFDVRGI